MLRIFSVGLGIYIFSKKCLGITKGRREFWDLLWDFVFLSRAVLKGSDQKEQTKKWGETNLPQNLHRNKQSPPHYKPVIWKCKSSTLLLQRITRTNCAHKASPGVFSLHPRHDYPDFTTGHWRWENSSEWIWNFESKHLLPTGPSCFEDG